MKIKQIRLGRLAIAMAAAYPAFAFAVPPAASAYNTDTQNIFVQDQTTEVLKQMNGVLCHIQAMRPDAMVGKGNYVALIDGNVCSPQGSGGKSSNTGPAYAKGIVNSTMGASTMLANAWVDDSHAGGTIYAHVSATQAPSATQPYGLFRVDYCGVPNGTTCAMKGYVDVTAAGGLKFFSYEPWMPGVAATSQLQLNGASATAGSGSMGQAITGIGAPPSSAFTFAYDANLFRRSDGVNDQCFSRDPLQAAESVWSYSLYDIATGAQVTRNSGFPIEYTDANGTQNGYIGYYGLWTPTTPTTTTVNQVTYGANGAAKTPYTLLQSGGKLTKFTKVATTLAALDKVTFWFFPQGAVGGVFALGTGYELYWDKATSTFMISGDLGVMGMVPRATPTAVLAADMLTASPYGLFGWSQALGGDFAISYADFANLATGLSNTPVITHTQDIVYPADFAALRGLKCIGDCPTAADIALASPNGSVASPFGATANAGWLAVPLANLTSYTLNATTGNLVDPANTVVVNTATTGNLTNGIQSGRMVAAADMQALDTAKVTANAAVLGSSPAGSYTLSDVDLISTYYIWETGPNSWNQVAVLKDAAGANVKFDAPLQVNFAVPNTPAKYGNFAGGTIQLQYGGVGNLWGIPYKCVDLTTNAACNFAAGGTTASDMRWAPEFSIPFDPAVGVVTVANTVGAVTAGTQYLAKGLDVERRLAKVALTTCTNAGLTLPAAAGITLPDATGFQDPGPAGGINYIGVAPVLNPMPAPRVIHGDVKY